MPRALFFEPWSEVAPVFSEHRKRQTAFAGNIVMGEEEAMREDTPLGSILASLYKKLPDVEPMRRSA
jgi:hypothetical protein